VWTSAKKALGKLDVRAYVWLVSLSPHGRSAHPCSDLPLSLTDQVERLPWITSTGARVQPTAQPNAPAARAAKAAPAAGAAKAAPKREYAHLTGKASANATREALKAARAADVVDLSEDEVRRYSTLIHSPAGARLPLGG
jgi:hypothetical protein